MIGASYWRTLIGILGDGDVRAAWLMGAAAWRAAQSNRSDFGKSDFRSYCRSPLRALQAAGFDLFATQAGVVAFEIGTFFEQLDRLAIRLYQIVPMVISLNPDKASIFRITHIANVPWILSNGLHCKSAELKDPSFVQIGNPELIYKRETKNVPVSPGGSLSNYIPFYFTPFSMMMYNIVTGYGGIRQFPNKEIVILVSSLRSLEGSGVQAVFTDRHAYLRTARFFNSLDKLSEIDWTILQRKDFRRDPDDPEKTDRYQAEALIHRCLPVERLAGIACHGENEKRVLDCQQEEVGLRLKIIACPSWYF